MAPEGNTSHLLVQVSAKETWAREHACGELLTRASQRLGRLARHMLDGCRAARRWVEPEDLLQEAQVRLLGALRVVPFQSSRHFWNTATRHLRFALIDLVRRHNGPEAEGAHHHTDYRGRAADDEGQPLQLQPDEAEDAASLEDWARFHEAVSALPEHHRALFDLLYYEGMTQPEAAQALDMPLRTLKCHWQKARGELGRRLRER